VARLTVTARNIDRLRTFADRLKVEATAEVEVTTDNRAAVKDADIVVAAAISTHPVVKAEDVRPGAVVCDVGYPKNISAGLEARRDVLAFSGGLAQTPVEVDPGPRNHLPAPDVLYGCFSEAMVLALEGRSENYSTGRGGISLAKMEEIGQAATKHGFKVAAFWANERRITREDIATARRSVSQQMV
jgi:predicted amino acid dehydrogenase